MNAMGYLKRIGKGVKALGSDGGSSSQSSSGGGDGFSKIAGGVAKEIGGLFKKKSKASTSKYADYSKIDDVG